jgi:hypothetical protein
MLEWLKKDLMLPTKEKLPWLQEENNILLMLKNITTNTNKWIKLLSLNSEM